MHVADRAVTPQEIMHQGSEFTIDYEYYLAKQILPPIDRLCAPVEGTDAARIADCLGLDTSKYNIMASITESNNEIQPLESQISDEERFRDIKQLQLVCLQCKTELVYEGIIKSQSIVSPLGIKCSSCNTLMSLTTLLAQSEIWLRQCIKQYYEGWLICDDVTCQNRTRMMSVYGKRCLREGCRGQMSYEYSDKAIYNQLLYAYSIFDCDKAKKNVSKSPVEQMETVYALAENNRESFSRLCAVVELYLGKCGRRYVDMASIFRMA